MSEAENDNARELDLRWRKGQPLKPVLEQLYKELLLVDYHGPVDGKIPGLKYSGLCHVLTTNSNLPSTFILDTFRHWPEFTGDTRYPVQGGEQAFDSTSLMWEGDYGAARLRLLKFFIDSIV